MIIIDTKNGTAFVNDKMIEICKHSRKESEVSVSDGNRMTIINDVVSIRYVSDNHNVDFKEDGNELEELQKRFDERTRWCDQLRKGYIDLEEEIAELKSKVKDNVFIVVEDCDNDETRNVACFSTESAAQKYCDHYNEKLSKPRFCFEEWKIGESYNYNTQEK